MPTCVIEFNDAGVAVGDADALRRVSPGCICVNEEAGEAAHNDALLIGEPALRRLRTHPRDCFDRFWTQLDQQPLPRVAGPARTHADLAYFHLRALWGSLDVAYDEAILAVPSGLELPLLLGVARACGLPVAGVAPSGLAVAAAASVRVDTIVLDAQWHQLTADRIEAATALRHVSGEVIAWRGLASLYERWAQMAAEAFVAQTRFDPFNDAASEQALYAALPGWLDTLADREGATLSLQAGGRTHRVELDRQQLAASAEPLYRPLLEAAANAGDVAIVLGERLRGLPGLLESLGAEAHQPVVSVGQHEMARCLLGWRERFGDPADREPVYVRQLPLGRGEAAGHASAESADAGHAAADAARGATVDAGVHAATEAAAEAAMGAAAGVAAGVAAEATAEAEDRAAGDATGVQETLERPAPTHIAHRGIARPLDARGVRLPAGAALVPGPGDGGPTVRLHDGTTLHPVAPAAGAIEVIRRAGDGPDGLGPGDELRIGEESYQLIAVTDASRSTSSSGSPSRST